MSRKVLVIGLDGATFDVIRPLVAEGRLPNLAAMMRNGAHGTLRSTIPPVSPSAWTSVFTGKNAGKHGIFGFQELDPRSYEFRTVRTDEHREKTLWHLLGEAGLRSIVMDVPFTYPPRPLNGLMLTGYGTPRTPGTVFSYPEQWADRLPYELRSEVRVALPMQRFDRSRQFIDEWQDVMAGRRRLLNHLIRTEDWDFFMVVFSITDNMAHVFWTYLDPAHPNYYREEAPGYRDAFLHSYELCDLLLGDLMEEAGPETTTLVLSDHGFGSVRPRQYVFQRLLQGRYVQPRATIGPAQVGNSLVRAMVTTYNRLPFLREWVKSLKPGQRQNLIQRLTNTGLMPSGQNIDFARSRVIPSDFGLRMWINGRPRFAAGVVPETDMESELAGLAAFLKRDVDPATGETIIANTYLGSELYHGPFAGHGPDLVIEYRNFYQPGRSDVVRNAHVEGGHTPEGIFLAGGADISEATVVKNASLIDLAPTVLYLLNQPIPLDMDGRVLEEIMTPELRLGQSIVQGDVPAQWLLAPESPTEAGYSKDQEAEMQEQLRQLGYID